MKNLKLQELLKQYPDDIEITVGNCDIVDLEQMASSYDGRQEILIRDSDDDKILGAKYRSSGCKVKIYTMSIESLLLSNPDIPVDASELPEHYIARIEDWRKEGYKIREIRENRRKNINNEQ